MWPTTYHGGKRYTLVEAKVEQVIKEIWGGESVAGEMHLLGDVEYRPRWMNGPSPFYLADLRRCETEKRENYRFKVEEQLLAAFVFHRRNDEVILAREREEAEAELNHWAQYIAAFARTYGRVPVVYDLFCGEGAFSRGVVTAGYTVYGFDILPRPSAFGMTQRPRLQTQGRIQRDPVPGMFYQEQDLTYPQLWDYMYRHGCAPRCPCPDLIHASPPCGSHTTPRNIGRDRPAPPSLVRMVAGQLKEYQNQRLTLHAIYVPWSIENMPEAMGLLKQGTDQVSGCNDKWLVLAKLSMMSRLPDWYFLARWLGLPPQMVDGDLRGRLVTPVFHY